MITHSMIVVTISDNDVGKAISNLCEIFDAKLFLVLPSNLPNYQDVADITDRTGLKVPSVIDLTTDFGALISRVITMTWMHDSP